jgi:myo-inositol-1(or 4)-monophosphatase
MDTAPLNTAEILQHATRIAREAGQLLLQYSTEQISRETKSSTIDIVTEADRSAEAYINRELERLYPAHHIVGEEEGDRGAAASEAGFVWYVDPLDGTTNYANHIPHYCVSLGLTDTQRRPLVGVVYEPTRDELYSAITGEGAHLNGQPLRVSTKDELLQCVVASGFAYDKHENPDNNVPQWEAFMLKTRGVRRIGSAALDLAYVAAGRFDGYWERSLNPWDALAGMLLVQEAGGTVTDYEGGDAPQFTEDGRYVASNGHIHEAMLAVLADSYSP